jgi:hypothetical protein
VCGDGAGKNFVKTFSLSLPHLPEFVPGLFREKKGFKTEMSGPLRLRVALKGPTLVVKIKKSRNPLRSLKKKATWIRRT